MSGLYVNGGEIMYRQGGSRAEMWRLKSVPPVAFNQERPNSQRLSQKVHVSVHSPLA